MHTILLVDAAALLAVKDSVRVPVVRVPWIPKATLAALWQQLINLAPPLAIAERLSQGLAAEWIAHVRASPKPARIA